MNDLLPPRTEIMDQILDTVHPPVARFRVMSNGLAVNNTLKVSDDIAGTQACLSCGNCVDACPVVASKPAGTMFTRTSMLLENVVGDECRRCHRCVAACPQVSRPIKDYVRGYRRIERVSHWDLLVSYLILMTTGILINHWGNELPTDLRMVFGLVHRVFTVCLVAAPIFLLLFDRHHFGMIARKALSWSGQDREWMRDSWRWITSLGKQGRLKRGAYNPGQRFWYVYVPVALILFAVTGVIKWMGPQVAGEQLVGSATAVHATVALITDILLLLHVWLKLGWPIVNDVIKGTRQHLALARRRKEMVVLRTR